MSTYELMTSEELLAVRNFLNKQEAKLLCEYLANFVMQEAEKPNNTDAEIRGMLNLLNEIKHTPRKLERVLDKR